MKKRINKILEILGNFFTRYNYAIKIKKFTNYYKSDFAFFLNDKVSKEISVTGLFEKDEMQIVLKNLKKKLVFLDVGANIGNHSIFFSKYFKRVLSFEPHPKIFQILKINVAKIKNIKIFNYALTRRKKIFFLSDSVTNNLAGSSLQNKGSIKIVSEVFDKKFKNIKNEIGLIKIDVEGHERQVIEGMKDTLIRNDPILFLEMDPESYKKNLIIKILKNLGFKYFYYFSTNHQDDNSRFRYIPIIILRILFFGIRDKYIFLKNLDNYKNNNALHDNIVCSKHKLKVLKLKVDY